MFAAIHGKGAPLWNEKDFFDWAASKGLDRKKVEELYNSFAIVGKVNRAKQLAQAYNIQSVPTMIVDGKYATGPEQLHGGHASIPSRDRCADRQGARRTTEVLAADSRDARLPHRRVVGSVRRWRGITQRAARRSACSHAARPSSRALGRKLAPASVATYAGDVRDAGGRSPAPRPISLRDSACPTS